MQATDLLEVDAALKAVSRRYRIIDKWDTLGIQSHTMPNAVGLWYEEMHYLIWLLEQTDFDKNWVEIGAFCGGSACLMNIVRSLYKDGKNGSIVSVDVDFNPMFDINLKRLSNDIYHYKLEIDSCYFDGVYDEILYKSKNKEVKEISFAFIDGFHSYEQVLKDFEQVQPFLSEDAIVAFHDVSPFIFDENWQEKCRQDGWCFEEGEEDFRLDEAILDIMDEHNYELIERPSEFECQHFQETGLTEWVRGTTSPFNAVVAIRKINADTKETT